MSISISWIPEEDINKILSKIGPGKGFEIFDKLSNSKKIKQNNKQSQEPTTVIETYKSPFSEMNIEPTTTFPEAVQKGVFE